MNGEVAMDLALVMTGNAALSGELVRPWRDNPIYQFAESVAFLAPTGKSTFWLGPPTVADDPDAWIENLKGQCRGLRLRHVEGELGKNRMLAGFSGGGEHRIIEAVGRSASDLWEAAWEIGDRDDPQSRIWRVAYSRIGKDWTAPLSEDRPMADITAELRETLTDIAAFADEQRDLGSWSRIFTDALDLLDPATPLTSAEAELFPRHLLTPDACRLLDACGAAWVFGGMGSWNDLGFDGAAHERYEALSHRLYGLVSEGPAAAANSTFKLPPLQGEGQPA